MIIDQVALAFFSFFFSNEDLFEKEREKKHNNIINQKSVREEVLFKNSKNASMFVGNTKLCPYIFVESEQKLECIYAYNMHGMVCQQIFSIKQYLTSIIQIIRFFFFSA